MAEIQAVVLREHDLRSLLKASGLSQASFARRIGCSVNTVNAWCSGRNVGSVAYRLAVMWLELEIESRGSVPAVIQAGITVVES